MPFQPDIHTGVQTAIFILSFFAILSVITGARSILHGRRLQYYRMRQEHIFRGWRQIFFALVMAGAVYLLKNYAEPVAYSFYPPSPTPTVTPSVTLTPTISPTPTISLTPTITPTPSVSDTPTITPTPHVPLAIEAQFEGRLTPPAGAAFSKLQFTNQGIDDNFHPINPTEVFTNPVGTMYAVFTYDGMEDGVQWTALWYRGSELVNFETLIWDGGTGGFGFTEWSPKAENWLPGVYQVQIFVGVVWKRVGFFTVVGDPPTQTPTASPTPTATITPTPTPSSTLTPSPTPRPTLTPTPTGTPPTPLPTATPIPTITRRPTATPITPTPTLTRWPTATPLTPTPTLTRWPTATPGE